MTDWMVKTRTFSHYCALPDNPYLLGPEYSEDFASSARHQREFEVLESKKLAERRIEVENVLKDHIESDTRSVVLAICGPAVADYHHVYRSKDSKCWWKWTPSDSDLVKLLQGTGHFGDIIQIGWFESFDSCNGLCYAIEDISTGSFIKLDQSLWKDFDIPTRITDDLCDPIQFYRFCAPIEGCQHLRRIYFSFGHPYMQRLLGINSENRKDLDCVLLASWTYYFKQQDMRQFRMYSKDSPKSFPQHPNILNIVTHTGQQVELNLPISFPLFRVKAKFNFSIQELMIHHLRTDFCCWFPFIVVCLGFIYSVWI